MQQVSAELNGFATYSVHVTHRPGAAATDARVELPREAGERLREGAATLRLSDQRTTLTLSSLSIRSISIEADVARVTLSDRRSEWHAPAVDLDGVESLGEAVALILRALGESPSLASLKRRSESLLLQHGVHANAQAQLEALLMQHGQSCIIDVRGKLRAIPLDTRLPRRASYIERDENALTSPGKVTVIGGPLLRESVLESSWVSACENESGAYVALNELLADWSVSPTALASGVLIPEGVAPLVAAATPEEEAIRTKLLEAHAWKSWLWEDDERFVAARVSVDGEVMPPLIEHDGYRALDRNLTSLADPYASPSSPEPVAAGFALDPDRKLIRFDQPTGVLNSVAPPVHDTRLEGRSLDAPPNLRVTVSRVIAASMEVMRVGMRSRGASRLVVQRGELLGIQGANAQGTRPDNANELRERARDIARRVKRATPIKLARALIAGACEATPQLGGRVEWRADAQGLVTEIIPDDNAFKLIGDAFSTPALDLPVRFEAPRASSKIRTQINAYTHGPIVMRASGTADPAEACVGAEVDSFDAASNALSITNLAPLRTPFHLANANPSEAGGWFFAAPVRQTSAGIELLEDASSETTDFDPQTATALNEATLPEGCDGLLVRALDGSTQLVLFDQPLIAQHRGNSIADYSVEVRDIDGDELDAIRRGGLQFSLVLSLSPVHQASGVGGTATERGWVPALNLKDLNSGSTEDFMRAGRGLFAETGGLHLGRLAHLPLQAGPIMADASNCTKHRYAQLTTAEGTHIECAGHISTEGFFKVPGSEFFDGPIAFTQEETQALVPIGTQYRAEIRFNPGIPHEWNNTNPMGKWVVVYNMPFTDLETPPEWQPHEDQVAAWSKNQAGPSFDWAPPPSGGPPEEAIEYPGITIKAVGYAPETDGVPDASAGGGIFFLPGELDLMSGSPWTHAGPNRSVLLHPSLGLAFGLPRFDGDGSPISGAQIKLDESGELCITPLDASGDVDEAATVHVEAQLHASGNVSSAALELAGQEANPGETPAATLWVDDDAGDLHFGDGVVLTRSASGPPEVSGSRDGNAALASLLTALDSLGIITDSTVA